MLVQHQALIQILQVLLSITPKFANSMIRFSCSIYAVKQEALDLGIPFRDSTDYLPYSSHHMESMDQEQMVQSILMTVGQEL